MKIKKKVAVLSAAAVAVTSLSVAAFAAAEPAAKDAALKSITLYDTFDYAAKDQYDSNIAVIGKDNIKIEGTTVTVTVDKEKIGQLQSTLKKGDQGGQDAIFCIKLVSNVAKSDVSEVKWGGTTQTKDTFFDGDDYINYWVNIASGFDADKKVTGLKDTDITTAVYFKDSNDKEYESTITVKVVVKEASPQVPEGYTDLNNWNANVEFNAKDAKAGDKLVIDLANVGDNAQISINNQSPWAVLPGFAALEGYDSEFNFVSVAKDSTKYEYTFTEADITAINGGKITVKGKDACVKLSLVSNGSGDNGDNGGNIINDPVTPNIRPSAPTTEAAATTTEAPAEVVTGANGESVEAPKDVIPTGAVLEAKEQPKEEAVKAVEAITTNDTNKEAVDTVKKAVEDGKAAVMDINLVKDGAKVQPNGSIKAIINIPEILKNAAKLFVYRVEANGTFTDVNASVVDGKLVFTTSHFSTYIITSEALSGDAVVTEAAATTTAAPAAATTAAGGNGSSTDDKNQATGVVIAVIPAMLAAAGVIAAKKRK